jgi:hypothetical protein
LQKTVTIIATVQIAWGSISLIAAFLLYVIVAGAGAISGDHEAMMVTTIVASAISIPMFFLSLPPIIGGIALLKRKSWARIVLIACGIIELLVIPLGTVLGIFTIRYMMDPEVIDLFEGPYPPAGPAVADSDYI